MVRSCDSYARNMNIQVAPPEPSYCSSYLFCSILASKQINIFQPKRFLSFDNLMFLEMDLGTRCGLFATTHGTTPNILGGSHHAIGSLFFILVVFRGRCFFFSIGSNRSFLINDNCGEFLTGRGNVGVGGVAHCICDAFFGGIDNVSNL